MTYFLHYNFINFLLFFVSFLRSLIIIHNQWQSSSYCYKCFPFFYLYMCVCVLLGLTHFYSLNKSNYYCSIFMSHLLSHIIAKSVQYLHLLGARNRSSTSWEFQPFVLNRSPRTGNQIDVFVFLLVSTIRKSESIDHNMRREMLREDRIHVEPNRQTYKNAPAPVEYIWSNIN